MYIRKPSLRALTIEENRTLIRSTGVLSTLML